AGDPPRAQSGGEDPGKARLERLLVARRGGDQGRRPKRRERGQAQAREEPLDARGVARRQAPALGEAESEEDAVGDGLAMPEVPVGEGRLDRVTQGVAEIEQPAL